MSAPFGFLSTGFNRKRLPDILAELEQGVENIFGNDVIQSDASVFGQFHGVYSAAIAEAWERLEELSWNLDPRTASGQGLDSIAWIMTGSGRLSGETDEQLRRRLGIDSSALSQAQNLTDDLILKLRLLNGVDVVTNYINETNQTDEYGLPPHSYAPVIAGNPDLTELADIIWKTHPVGITVHGSVPLQAIGADGRCHKVAYTPACKVYIAMRVFVCFRDSKCCTNYDLEEMRQALVDRGKSLIGKCPGFDIGEPVDRSKLFSALDQYTGVQITDIKLERRAKEFVTDIDCTPTDNLTYVTNDDGEAVLWAAENQCDDGSCQPEAWCDNFDKDNVCLGFNEYPDFDQVFIQFFTVDCDSCGKKEVVCEEPPVSAS